MCSFFMQKAMSSEVIHKLKIFQIRTDRQVRAVFLCGYPPVKDGYPQGMVDNSTFPTNE